MSTQNKNPEYAAKMKYLQGLRMMDDIYFQVAMRGESQESKQLAELILRIILKDDSIEVLELHSGYTIPNALGKACKMDAVAKDSTGRIFDVEMQRDTSKATPQRDRYYSSMLDIQQKPKKENYTDLKDTYVIFVMEFDEFKAGLPLYHIEPYITELKQLRPNGAHTIYVNGAYTADDALGRLMHDIKCANHDDMHYEVMKQCMAYFKHSDKGVQKMIDSMGEYGEFLIVKNTIALCQDFGLSDTDTINKIASQLQCPRPKAEEYFYEFSAAQQPTASV